jgi:hypothetical protein
MTIQLPGDVRDWLLTVFGALNHRVSEKLARIPTSHEVSLDLTFIEHLSQVSVPVRFPSLWTIWIDTHYLGGLRHFLRRWEIADIGVLVMYRHQGKLVRSKVALLQSKRLYPDEQHIDEDVASMYLMGFGRMYEQDSNFENVTAAREFTVHVGSKYRALLVADGQYKAIAEYEIAKKIPVHYLFYNPLMMPMKAVLPVQPGQPSTSGECRVGVRVMRAVALRTLLAGKPNGYQPAYGDLLVAPFAVEPDAAGWRLEHFIVELLLNCQEGHIASGPNDEGLQEVFLRRTGPIAAAIAINIDSPVEFPA